MEYITARDIVTIPTTLKLCKTVELNTLDNPADIQSKCAAVDEAAAALTLAGLDFCRSVAVPVICEGISRAQLQYTYDISAIGAPWVFAERLTKVLDALPDVMAYRIADTIFTQNKALRDDNTLRLLCVAGTIRLEAAWECPALLAGWAPRCVSTADGSILLNTAQEDDLLKVFGVISERVRREENRAPEDGSYSKMRAVLNR